MEAVRLPAKEDVDEFCEELAEELTEELTERERRQYVALGVRRPSEVRRGGTSGKNMVNLKGDGLK